VVAVTAILSTVLPGAGVALSTTEEVVLLIGSGVELALTEVLVLAAGAFVALVTGASVDEVCEPTAAGAEVDEVWGCETTGAPVEDACEPDAVDASVEEVCASEAAGPLLDELCESETVEELFEDDSEPEAAGALLEEVCDPDCEAAPGCAGGGVTSSAKTGTTLSALMASTNRTVNSITLKRLFLNIMVALLQLTNNRSYNTRIVRIVCTHKY